MGVVNGLLAKFGLLAIGSPLDIAANEAATSPLNGLKLPTEWQKEKGRYKKGRYRLHGLDIAIENPKWSTRSGIDADGTSWETELQHHYGDIEGTKGADGDAIDIFLSSDAENEGLPIYIINQVNPGNGKFDEHKVMIGFQNKKEAKSAYQSNYAPGWKGAESIVKMSIEEFKDWLMNGDTIKQAEITMEMSRIGRNGLKT